MRIMYMHRVRVNYRVIFPYRAGKLCSSHGQQYVNDEEGLDGNGFEGESDQRVGSHGFLHTHRNSQVSPEGTVKNCITTF